MGDVTPQLEATFDAAVDHVNNKKESYSKNHTLRFYGLYKHITVGKWSKRSGTLRFKGKAKTNAWKACEELSVKEAIEQYIKLVADIDDSFKPNKISKIDEVEAQVVADLNSLPPPTLPKGIHERYFKMQSKSSPDVMVDMQRNSGFDPASNTYDDEERIILHEKLIKYYRAVDPDRLLSGIGEVVDYALAQGENKLNAKLKSKYGIDLIEIEEKAKRRRKSSVKPSSRPTPATVFRTADFRNLSAEEAQALADSIEKFFSVFDPEKVKRGIATGFIELVLYIDRRGVEALNKKLAKKYGKSLDDLDVDESPSNENSEDKMILSNEVDRMSSKSSMLLVKGTESFTTLNQAQLDEIHAESKSSTLEFRERTKSEALAVRSLDRIELPGYVKPALVSFYMRYEPNKLKDGSAKRVYAWAKRNGLRKLNKELKRRYKQSLDEFVDDSDKLKAELITFYKQIDETKISNGLDKILHWGIKNGRKALNAKFMKKYGFDLDSYNDPEIRSREPKLSVKF